MQIATFDNRYPRRLSQVNGRDILKLSIEACNHNEAIARKRVDQHLKPGTYVLYYMRLADVDHLDPRLMVMGQSDKLTINYQIENRGVMPRNPLSLETELEEEDIRYFIDRLNRANEARHSRRTSSKTTSTAKSARSSAMHSPVLTPQIEEEKKQSSASLSK